MTVDEARELVRSPIWANVRDEFLASGSFEVIPVGDIRRLGYLPAEERKEIALWQEGLMKAGEWRTVVDGAKVRELKAKYPGVYPEAMRYLIYFERHLKDATEFPEEATKLLLKLRFPDAYRLCYG